jgi:ubiquitin C-terminal hydrolase
LNLRKVKPYTENPSFEDGRDQNELGLEFFSNQLKREWSFIYFLFYGQMKSRLKCCDCQKISITYDPFAQVALPIPEPKERIINFIVHRLPNSIKDLLNGEDPKMMREKLESARSGKRQLVI